MRFMVLFLSLGFAFAIYGVSAIAQVRYMGTTPQPMFRPQGLRPFNIDLTYMTASQMAEQLRSFTGFYHSGFETFADVLGRMDQRTGIRTTDRPTAISVMVMQKLTLELAEAVVERELFIDDEDRIVFRGIDLLAEPEEVVVRQFAATTCNLWLKQLCVEPIINEMTSAFQISFQTDGNVGKAWQASLNAILATGTIYYY